MPSRPSGFDFVETQGGGHQRGRGAAASSSASRPAGGTAPSRCRCGRRATPVSCSTNNRPATRYRTSRPSACRCPTPPPPRRRAAELMAPVAYRRTYATEQALRRGRRTRWHRDLLGHATRRRCRLGDEFENGLDAVPTPVRGIDHVNLAQPWQTFDDAVLFLTSVFGLSADAPTEVAGSQRPGAQPGRCGRPTARCGCR